MYNTPQYQSDLEDCLMHIAFKLRRLGQRSQTSMHVQSETFFKEVLNRYLDYGLEEVPARTPGIDLYWKGLGISYQITTENSAEKIRNTVAGVKSLIKNGAIGPISELNVLFLTYGEGKPEIPADCRNLPFEFGSKNVFDLEDVQNDIFETYPHKIPDLTAFLYREFAPLSKSILASIFTPAASFKASFYKRNDPFATIYAGNYWGLNRGSFTGLYINDSGSDQLLNELGHTEGWLREGSEQLTGRYPSRFWYPVSFRAEETPSESLNKLTRAILKASDAGDSTIPGFYLSINIAPRQLFFEYNELIADWFLAFEPINKRLPAAALVVNINCLAEDLPADLYPLTNYLGIARGLSDLEILYSAKPAEPEKARMPLLDAYKFLMSESVAGESSLELLFRYVLYCDPKDRIVANKVVCSLIKGHENSFRRAAESVEQGEACNLTEVLDICAFNPDAEGLRGDMVNELLTLSTLPGSRQNTAELITAAATHKSSIINTAALGFALNSGNALFLDSFIRANLKCGKPLTLPALKAHREEMIFALMRQDSATREAQQQIIEWIRTLSQGLRLSPFLQRLIAIHGAGQSNKEAIGSLIDGMSYLDTVKFIKSGLSKKHFKVTEILAKINRSQYPGFFWKTLFFNQKVTGDLVSELSRTEELEVRAVPGLCTADELTGPVYLQLLTHIKNCRNFL